MNTLIQRLRKGLTHLRVKILKYQYRDRPYSEYYTAVMKVRTTYDPRFAVGGMWDEIGQLQFEFLREQGLRPEHTLLDFGCGSLRGGLHFIRYLERGNYSGVDISPDALEAGRRFLAQAGLGDRDPVLKLTPDERIRTGLAFDDLGRARFDFILAQSVLTHMPLADIETLFANIRKVMHPQTVFFATFLDGGDRTYETQDRMNFYYPFDTLRSLGEKHGLEIRREESYSHPRAQKMMTIRLASERRKSAVQLE